MYDPIIDDRFERLEKRVAGLEAKLDAVAMQPKPAPAGALPPVIVQPPVQAVVPPQTPRPPVPQAPRVEPPMPATPRVAPPQTKTDEEFIIGARLFPRIGAVLMLLSLAFFVSWAYTHDLISPQLAFVGELAAAFACGALGFVLRKTREGFGLVLQGLASAGLFMAGVAGHQYHHVYSGQAMVAFCLVVAVGNMLYGASAGGNTFVAIGLIGGMLTSWMPIAQAGAGVNEYQMAEVIQMVVILSTLVISILRKNQVAALAGWSIGIIAQLPLLFARHGVAKELVLGCFASITVASIGCYGYAKSGDSESDPNAWFPILASILFGLLVFLVDDSKVGSLFQLGTGLALGLVGFAFHKDELLLSRILGASAILVGAFAPLGLSGVVRPSLLIALGFISLLIAWYRQSPSIGWISILQFAAAGTLALFYEKDVPLVAHQVFAALILVAHVPTGMLYSKFGDKPEIARSWLAMSAWVCFWRLGALFDNYNPFGVPVSLAWSAFGLAAIVFGVVFKFKELRSFGYAAFFVTLGKVLLVDLSSISELGRVAVLLGLGVAMLAGGYVVIHMKSRESAE